MPQEVPQRVPLVTIHVDVIHTTPQARLQIPGVPPKQIHDGSPRQRRKGGPRDAADPRAGLLARDEREAGARRDGNAGEGEGHAGEDVDYDLLVYGGDATRGGGAAEDEVAA